MNNVVRWLKSYALKIEKEKKATHEGTWAKKQGSGKK
jgi:hypothetical protein